MMNIITQNKQQKKWINDLFVLIIYSFIYCIAPIIGAESLSTHFIVPGLLLFYFIRQNIYNIFSDISLKYYSIFVLLTLLSLINAVNNSNFNFDTYLTVSRNVIFSYFFVLLISISIANTPERIYTFFTVYIVSFFVFFCYVYIIYKGNFSLQHSDRFSKTLFDANMFGYFAIFSIFSSIFLELRFRNILTKGAILISILFSVVIVTIAATRSGFYMLLVAFILIFFSIVIVKPKSIFKKIFTLILFVIFLIGLSIAYSYVLERSYLGVRINRLSETEDERILLVKEGIKLGMENPILGLGGGQFQNRNTVQPGIFSHNAYIEIFANYGLITLFFYLLLHYSIYKKIQRLWRLKNKTNLDIARISFVFLIVFVIYNIFYVMYLSFTLFTILFIVNALLKEKLCKNYIPHLHKLSFIY